MRPPRTIKVGAATWTLKPVDGHTAKMTDDDGALVAAERWLTYNLGLHPQREREIIVHEALHAVVDQIGGYKALGLDDGDDEERLVSLLTAPIFGLLRDNPKLIAYLTEAMP